jgi:hypothetical protein
MWRLFAFILFFNLAKILIKKLQYKHIKNK